MTSKYNIAGPNTVGTLTAKLWTVELPNLDLLGEQTDGCQLSSAPFMLKFLMYLHRAQSGTAAAIGRL